METTINHWLLKKYEGKYAVASNDYPTCYTKLLEMAGVPTGGGKHTAVAWKKMVHSFSFNYEYPGSEGEIRDMLRKSSLMDYSEISFELGWHNPIVSFQMETFIENWYEIAALECHVGTLCFTSDCKLILEFGSDNNYLLFSNFKIK